MCFHFFEVDLFLLIYEEAENEEDAGDVRKAVDKEILGGNLGKRELEVGISLQVDVFLPVEVEFLEDRNQVRAL